MSLKNKYQDWQAISEAIRPIWEANKGEIRGNTELWDIIHTISANGDLYRDLKDIMPVIAQQFPWMIKRYASRMDEKLAEIEYRRQNHQPITRPGQQSYNLPAFYVVMSIKDIVYDITDNERKIKWPDGSDGTQVFEDTNRKTNETEAQLNILKGMRQMYDMYNQDPATVEHIIEHIDQRIRELENL